MIKAELRKILSQAGIKSNNRLYLRNLLKEYLQAYVLFFIYTTDRYKEKLIFTGGTCLRHFYNLPRLSEDLDFDYEKKLDSSLLAGSLREFFERKYQYNELEISVKQDGKQILLKFPVLQDLGLSSEEESNRLYVKLDLSINPSENFNTIMSSKSLYNFNFIARHYDLPNLMAGKVIAIFQRDIKKGKDNRQTIKGRDYFDLLWYLKQDIKPNINRIKDILGKPNLNYNRLKVMLDKKIEKLEKKFMTDFKNDLLPLIENENFIEAYVNNYVEEYNRAVKYLQN